MGDNAEAKPTEQEPGGGVLRRRTALPASYFQTFSPPEGASSVESSEEEAEPQQADGPAAASTLLPTKSGPFSKRPTLKASIFTDPKFQAAQLASPTSSDDSDVGGKKKSPPFLDKSPEPFAAGKQGLPQGIQPPSSHRPTKPPRSLSGRTLSGTSERRREAREAAAMAPQTLFASGSLMNPEEEQRNEVKNIMADLAKQRRSNRKDSGKNSLFDKGRAAATALAAVCSILGSSVLSAVLNPSEVIFSPFYGDPEWDESSFRYGWCHSPGQGSRAVCGRLLVMYSVCCIITLVFNLLCLVSTIIVAIGMNDWLTLAYFFFLLAMVTQSLALVAALWISVPLNAAITGSVLLLGFLLCASVLTSPGVVLAWHFKFGLNKTLVLEDEKTKVGGQPTTRVVEGSTALHWAAYKGRKTHQFMLSVLLAAGESVDTAAQGADGWTPLMIAAFRRGNEAIVKQLLAAGADVTCQDIGQGRTALHWAAFVGNSETTKLLLQAGSDITFQDVQGATPAELAYSTGHETVAKAIDAFKNKCLEEELLVKVKWQNIEDMRHLLEVGAPANSKDNRDNTALHWCANRSFIEGVECLLEAGADVNSTNYHGSTPLLEAALSGDVAIVKLLLSNKANPHAAFKESSDTALHVAARRGYAEVVAALLNADAEVDRKAVDEAASRGHKSALSLMLTKVKDNFNYQSWLAAAAWIGSPLAVTLLLQRGDKTSEEDLPMALAAQEGHTEAVIALLKGGEPVDRAKDNKRTALHWAALEGHVETCRALLQASADPNCQDAWGNTPLHLAVNEGRGDKGVIQVLLEWGADSNIANFAGETPVMLDTLSSTPLPANMWRVSSKPMKSAGSSGDKYSLANAV